MKKENVYKILYGVSIWLIIEFAVRLGIDCFKYDSINNSEPFYALAIERAVVYIAPSIIVFIAGKIAKKKYSK